jgi:hypothetical protein
MLYANEWFVQGRSQYCSTILEFDISCTLRYIHFALTTFNFHFLSCFSMPSDLIVTSFQPLFPFVSFLSLHQPFVSFLMSIAFDVLQATDTESSTNSRLATAIESMTSSRSERWSNRWRRADRQQWVNRWRTKSQNKPGKFYVNYMKSYRWWPLEPQIESRWFFNQLSVMINLSSKENTFCLWGIFYNYLLLFPIYGCPSFIRWSLVSVINP